MWQYADLLNGFCEKNGIVLPAEAAEKFAIYEKMLLEWNMRMNLTSITAPEEIAKKHFIDSLLVFTAPDFPKSSRVIDIGTGAGFPGVVMLIARPDLHLTLLDAREKRLNFLRALLGELGLKAELAHARAEDAGKEASLRETFDAAVARAVAPMPALCEYCLPFVGTGGFFVALKGPMAANEIRTAEGAVKTLGGGNIKTTANEIKGAGLRITVVIEKKRHTPAEYPRSQAKIAKYPL